jgi:hypothetical protein
MKKPDIDIIEENDQIKNLLNKILFITKEAQSFAIKNDIVNLVKIIKLRQSYVGKLKQVCQSKKQNEEIHTCFIEIEKETTLLMEKMKLSKKILSRNLVSLYNGRQVVKYF